mgnify:CR=1 FL=1
MKRRRFLAISAAALALPPAADAHSTSWQSQALGGQLRVDAAAEPGGICLSGTVQAEVRGCREPVSSGFGVGASERDRRACGPPASFAGPARNF